MTGKTRLGLTIGLGILPVLLTVVLLFAYNSDDGVMTPEFINVVLDGMVITIVLPLTIMVFATAAFGHELKDKTLSFLVLKPVPRFKIILSKLIASSLISAPIVTASGMTVTLLITRGDIQTTVIVSSALFIGSLTYASVFTWAGLITSRALAFALVYVLLWEGILASFLSGIRYLSIRSYTASILHGLDDQTFTALGNRVIDITPALIGAGIVSIVFILLGIHRLRSMDVS